MLRSLFAFIILIGLSINGICQSGSLVFIKDEDTLASKELEPYFFKKTNIEINPFFRDGKIFCNGPRRGEIIDGILFIVKEDTIQFFSLAERLAIGTWPDSLLKRMLPDYDSLCAKKRNLVLIIDTYPFSDKDMEEFVKEEAVRKGCKPADLCTLTLSYQMTQVVFLPTSSVLFKTIVNKL